MPGPATEALNTDREDLRADIGSLRSDSAESRGESRVMLRLIGDSLLVTAIPGLVSGVWRASSLTTEVKDLSARVGRLEPAERS